MTSIIQRRVEVGSFSLKEFWVRRVRRLYPALLTMIGTVALLGGFILTNPERAALVPQSLAAVLSFSNILLWKTTGGYWDSDSENIAMLHTWSLSLEEQFYVIFPLLLLTVHRFARSRLRSAIVALAIVSLALCIYATPESRSAAFYLLPTRLWELLFGAMLALWANDLIAFGANKSGANLLTICGLGLILSSFYLIQNNKGFPGAYPIIPCLGTVAVLALGGTKGPVNSLLSSKPLNYIGRISYSLYLWHWPVIVFSRYLSVSYSPILILAVSLVLGSLSYHLIENPFRRGFQGSMQIMWAAPIIVAICLLPIVFYHSNPALSEKLGNIESPESMTRGWDFDATSLILKGKNGIVVGPSEKSPSIALVGSSHARVLSGALALFSEESDTQSIVLATSGAGITLKENAASRGASLLNSQRFAILERLRPKIIIVAGMWSSERNAGNDFKNNLEHCLARLSKYSERVIVLSQVPQCSLPPGYEKSLRKYLVALNRSGEVAKIEASNQAVEANSCVESIIKSMGNTRVSYLSIYEDLITKDGFVEVMRDGRLTYSDFHHLNDFGALIVFNRSIKPVLERLLSEFDSSAEEGRRTAAPKL